ncbi:cytochrome P450 2U1-like isoform X2 [Acanthaster planci]|uniref:Cytochrome P450 2U1-like isoform X2 n=1 Tax=Acanthaster planci TaxID=133434 RepID=A0A8B7YST1_ACAPL|nr:cytochrome P450 2U1-like isoform X2 [Acanthaster planci]
MAAKMFQSRIIASSGQVWMQSRRFCMNILRSFGVGKSSFEERIGREAEELIKEMSAFDGKPLDPKSLLMNAVANVICSVMFGKRYEYTDAEFRRLLYCISRNAELFGAGGVILFFPSLRHLPFFSTAELKANFDLLLEFLNDAVDAHRAALDANNPKDLIDMCLLEIKQHETQNQSPSVAPSGDLPNSSAYIKEENLHSIISDIFLAGSETTATTLQWLLLYVAVYPKIQQRVQAEIDAVVGRDRLPRMADKPELNFTRAVIWEVQRLCPVVPLGVAHAAASDTQFHGYTVPKETVLVSNLLMVFQDPKVWREPQKFDPGRFLNEEGKAIKADELIPFSVGKRSCIGDNLAKMELFIFFSYFMHQFTVRKPDDSPPLSLKGNVGLINPPVPFQICICKRE